MEKNNWDISHDVVRPELDVGMRRKMQLIKDSGDKKKHVRRSF